MNKGDISASEQLKSAISNKDLVQIHNILDRIITNRLVPEPWDEVALAREIRNLKGKLEGQDTRGWKRRGKIDRLFVARECRAALEKMGEEVTEEKRKTTDFNGRNGPFRRVNTGEFLVRIRNKNRG